MKFKQKLNLYVDADDTVLNSSEAIIKMLNQKNGTTKTYDDLTDWGYKSIDGKITREDVEKLYDSSEFFSIVETDPVFDEMVNEVGRHLNITVVTKGRADNLEFKRQYFENRYDGQVKVVGIPFVGEIGTEVNYDKSSVDMSGGICVDDRVDCLLSCNANVKILITHDKKFAWNKASDCIGVENLYIVKDWKEAAEIIKFTVANKFFLETID